jgi:hypothetical protein
MDPLRSFADLIGAMWRSRRAEVAPASQSSPIARSADARQAPAAERAPESLRARLRNRIVDVGTADPRLARDTFVEAVLGWELGEELARDPAFGEMVRRLSDHIEGEPRLNARLQQLLQELAREP